MTVHVRFTESIDQLYERLELNVACPKCGELANVRTYSRDGKPRRFQAVHADDRRCSGKARR